MLVYERVSIHTLGPDDGRHSPAQCRHRTVPRARWRAAKSSWDHAAMKSAICRMKNGGFNHVLSMKHWEFSMEMLEVTIKIYQNIGMLATVSMGISA